MGCGSSSPSARPSGSPTVPAPQSPPANTRDSAADPAPENNAGNADANADDATQADQAQKTAADTGAAPPSSPGPAPSKAAGYAADGLRGAAVVASLSPLPGSAPFSSVLRRCADLIASASSRPQWLADFHSYLSAVHDELTAASGAFSQQSHLEALMAELTKAEHSLREITSRSWLSAAAHSSADAQSLQQHRDQCERIKHQAIVQMLSEAQADTTANKTQAQQIQAVLAGTVGSNAEEAASTPASSQPAEAASSPAAASAPAASSSGSATSSAVSALSSLSSALAFVPLASAASLSASLDRCSGLIASIRSRSQWLAEFDRYLALVRADLASASAAFSRSSAYLTQLSSQIAQAEKLLRSIAARSAWKAPLYAAGDRQALQAQQAACEKIKADALSVMLTEMKADSMAVRSTVAALQKMLKQSEQAAQQLRMDHEHAEADSRLIARLQPIDLTSDVDRELDRFMPGTRANILGAVDRWLNIGGAPAAAANEPAAASAASASPSSAAALPTPSSASRLFWIRGGPGAGKSCVSAKLISVYSSEIVAVHFCRHDSADRRDPRRLVKSLAHQLAQRLPVFAEKLRSAIPAVFGADASTDVKSASDLWQQLLVAPLHAISDEVAAERAACGRKYALLIDALDEASLSGSAGSGSSDLLTLLASSAADLPAWLGIVVTSRPEAAIVAKLSRYTPLKMECDSEDNLADLRSFFTHCLRRAHAQSPAAADPVSTAPVVPAAAPANESALVDLLMTKSAGLFLLGRMMMEQHGLLRVPSSVEPASVDPSSSEARNFAADPLRVDEVAEWPAGLDAFYFTCMRRVRASIVAAGGRGAAPVESDGRRLPADLSVLLRIAAYVLCAAEPLSLGCIAEMFALKDAAAAFRLMAPVRALMPIATAEGQAASAAAAISPLCKVSVYHKSVRDWFLSPARVSEAAIDADAVYSIDESRTHATMTNACWQKLIDAELEPFAVPAASLSLPALCVDDVCAMMHPSSDSSSNHGSLPSSFLRYAVAFGPTHALSCSDGESASACAFLCHPQYLHVRCLLGQGMDLSAEYLAAKERFAKIASAHPDSSSVVQQHGPTFSLWISTLASPSASLSLFHRLYQSYSQEWIRVPELAYQYASSFPDDSIVSQLGRACLPWLRDSPLRTHTIATWQTKPSALPDLLSVFHCEGVLCMAISPDGSRLLTGENDAVRIRNAETSVVESTIALHGFHHIVNAVAVSPDGRWIGAGLRCDVSHLCEGPTWVLVFDALDQSLVCQFAGHMDSVLSVQFDKTSTLILSKDSSKEAIVQVCSVTQNRVLHSWPSQMHETHAVARFIDDSPDQILLLNQEISAHSEVRSLSGAVLVSLPTFQAHFANASGSKLVSRTWKPDAPKAEAFTHTITTVAGETLVTLPTKTGSDSCWSPDGQWIAVRAESIAILSAVTGARLCEFHVAVTPVQLLFSPDCARLFVRCEEAAFGISVFSTDAARRANTTAVAPVPAAAASQPAKGSLRKPAVAPTVAATAASSPSAAVKRNLTDLQLTADGHLAVVDDAAVRLLDPLTGVAVQQCPRSRTVLCASDGQTYTVSSGAHALRSLSASLTAVSLPDWDYDTTASDLSADCSLIAAGRLRDVRVFSKDTGAMLHEFLSMDVYDCCALRFSRDGKRLAVGHSGGKFRVWDLQSYETEKPWRSRLIVDVQRPQAVVGLEWNADDGAILLLLASKFRWLWNGGSACCGIEIRAPSGELVQQVLRCPHWDRDSLFMNDCTQPALNVIAWSPRRDMIAACNTERTLIIFSNAGAVLHSIRLHAIGRCVVWHADGKTIFTLSVDSALRCHTLPESLFAADASAAGATSSSSTANSSHRCLLSAASFDDSAFHRIVYED